ncbi:MAG: hypothetical protein CM1200mP41_25210 [Gammaproteobacteria bacterium]|nr:MAG: hypothetical protein CM1200mP41_25210 [Gammaproteobacteria bacterium]
MIEAEGLCPTCQGGAHELDSAEGIGVQYGTRRVLQHMDFSIEAGEVVTIVGPNGAGKSVFLRVLIGAEQPARDGSSAHLALPSVTFRSDCPSDTPCR